MLTATLRAAALASALALLFALPAAAATPCSSPAAGGEWPAYGHDAANTRAQPAEHGLGPAQAPRIAPAWVFSSGSTGDGTGFESTPIVDGGCVSVGSSGGVAYALDARSGHVVWRRRLDIPSPGYGGAIVGAPAVSGAAVIYLANENDAPYAIALDRVTGAVVWRSAPFVTSPPTPYLGYYANSSPVVVHADTMKPAWTALVGASCFLCNAASTAFDGSSIEGVATPGGTMFSLARDGGARRWLAPIADGIHYQGTSYADGVAWTVDGNGNLDAFDAASGRPVLVRPLSVDAHAPVTNSTSSGVAIAEHMVFTELGGLNGANTQTPGYVVGYGAP